MTLQLSTTVRNAILDAMETAMGTGVIIKIRTGAQPATCATADSGTVLATITAPSDWQDPASGGVKDKSGTFEDISADAAGTAAHYRVYDSGGSTCHEQGSVTVTGGGGDMTLDNTNIAVGQDITITSFSKTAPNP